VERYICIHGHFYQPPRENPWLEDVELQDSAYPYHDWNERITAECYEPNTASRILDADGWIRKIVNNYSRISFNFGPTLLSWMEKHEPEVLRAIVEADRLSRERFSGHGSALAQAYNHMIMPLANRRDKYTQVIWGIKDFEYRFGRHPEGMWLPETAVDLETLEIMAEQGVRFTILAPYQARRFRRIGADTWQDVGPGGIDPTVPYLINLPASGRTISVFFYNADISRAVAFEGLLLNGENFARRLISAFNTGRPEAQLVHIATDGETYGHHHPHGDMALAYALNYIETNKAARITNYGEFLEKHPPTLEVEINENTAWSCAHGVERWRNNCGCNSGQHPGWSQAWRAPLRNALNWLRNTIAPMYEEEARRFLKDPWAARNDYIEVILDRSTESLNRFLNKHAARPLEENEQVRVLKLLEMQRHAMLMFTSCGWFFDEISGIETVQVLQYACRVIQLAQELFGKSLEQPFLEILSQAKSNIPEHKDGAHVYEKFAKPAMVDLVKVGAHYAISSLFESYDEHSRIYSYTVLREDSINRLAGAAKLTLGKARVTSEITREGVTIVYGVVNFGYPSINGGVRVYQDEESYRKMVEEVAGAFDRVDFPEVVRLLDQYFDGSTFSLKHLFRDKQREILDVILDSTLEEVAGDYRRIYERHAPLMRLLQELNIPQPNVLRAAAEFVINTSLRQAFSEKFLDLERIKALLEEARMTSINLDGASLSYALKKTLNKLGEELRRHPTDLSLLEHLATTCNLVRSLPFEVDMWKVQNNYYCLLQTIYQDLRQKADQGDEEARTWVERFGSLGDCLGIKRNR
jgi:alpha-amylase/alpha-mannosidase (GH57 family)